MRSSYVSYALKIIKEKRFKTLFRQFYKVIAIPFSYIFKKPLCGPVHGIFVVNYECNQRCRMCDLYTRPLEYREKGMQKLTTQEMLKVIDDFADIGTSGIGFTGGEPILRKDIYELIRHAKGRDLFTHISSNGMAIDMIVAKELIGAGLDAVSFSLDGAKSDTHDMIRGVKGSFERVIKAINSFKKAKEELKRDFVIVSVCVINGKNINEVVDLIDVALDAGVDKVSFSPVHDIGLMRDKGGTLNDIWVSAQDIERADKIIDRLIDIKRKNAHIIDNTVTYLGLFKRAFRNKRLPFPCYAGYVSIGVDGYGNIFPCFGWMEMDRKAENIRNISLKEFWNSEASKSMREKTRDCRNCYWNNQTELNIAFSSHIFSDPRAD